MFLWARRTRPSVCEHCPATRLGHWPAQSLLSYASIGSILFRRGFIHKMTRGVNCGIWIRTFCKAPPNSLYHLCHTQAGSSGPQQHLRQYPRGLRPRFLRLHSSSAASSCAVDAPSFRRVILRGVRPHPAQALQARVVDGPSRGHRQLELAGPDPLPTRRQRGPAVVVLVELAEEDKADCVLAECREVPLHLRRQGQTLPTAGGDVVLSWASQWPCGETRATITKSTS